MAQGIVSQLYIQSAKTPPAILYCSQNYDLNFILGERIQGKDPAARQEGGDNLKGGIFRGSANKGDSAILDKR